MAISFIQKTGKSNADIDISFSSSVTEGNLIVVGITHYNGAPSSTQVTDNKGNSYTRIVINNAPTGPDYVAIYYAIVATGKGGTGVTLTTSGLINGSWSACEYSGTSASPLHTSNSGTGTSSTPTSGNVVTSVNGELLVAVAWSINNNDSWAAGTTGGSSFNLRDTEIDNNSNERYALEDLVVGGAGTYSGNFVVGAPTSQEWVCAVAVFSPTSTASTTTGNFFAFFRP